jgi:hypothetical protein
VSGVRHLTKEPGVEPVVADKCAADTATARHQLLAVAASRQISNQKPLGCFC